MTDKKSKIKLKIPGLKQAVDLLQRLDPKVREKIMDTISHKDAHTYQHLKSNMVVFQDLIFLTPKMTMELLREVSMEDLGLALRVADKNLQKHFLQNMSLNNQKDLNDILTGKPVPVSKVQEAQEKIMTLVHKKIERGEIVIDREGINKLV